MVGYYWFWIAIVYSVKLLCENLVLGYDTIACFYRVERRVKLVEVLSDIGDVHCYFRRRSLVGKLCSLRTDQHFIHVVVFDIEELAWLDPVSIRFYIDPDLVTLLLISCL